MRPKKFNFVSSTQLRTPPEASGPSTCSFSPKTGFITFGGRNRDLHKYRNAYVKVYADPSKRAIGWRFVESGPLGTLEGCSQIAELKEGAACRLYVPKHVRDSLGISEGSWKGLEIGSYSESPLYEAMHYVVLDGDSSASKSRSAKPHVSPF